MVRTRVGPGPPPDLDPAPLVWVAGPVQGGVGPRPWRFWTLPGGPVRTYRGPTLSHGPTVDILEYIVFSGHVAIQEPSTWWGRALFTTRLEVAAWAPCLHTVVRGTPV
jgi:hypothetical protein